jgi:hypothetical protein
MKKQQAYSFDRIRILSGQYLKSLHQRLPKKELERECTFFRLSPASEMAEKSNFSSSLEIVNPTQEFFRLLVEHERDLSSKGTISQYKDPKISYCEIARDTFYQNDHEAEEAAFELGKTLRKKWSSNNVSYDAMFDPDVAEKKDAKTKGLGDKAWYYGGDKFQFVLYPRLSKINEQPCVHEEWRISGATNIKKKTGISSIADFIEFNIQSRFEEMNKKYIVHEEIDSIKLGKWILGWDRRRKFTEDEKFKIKMQAGLFCRHRKIYNAADLSKYFKREKDRLKTKKGRKSLLDHKMLKASYRKFVVPSPYYNI